MHIETGYIVYFYTLCTVSQNHLAGKPVSLLICIVVGYLGHVTSWKVLNTDFLFCV